MAGAYPPGLSAPMEPFFDACMAEEEVKGANGK